MHVQSPTIEDSTSSIRESARQPRHHSPNNSYRSLSPSINYAPRLREVSTEVVVHEIELSMLQRHSRVSMHFEDSTSSGASYYGDSFRSRPRRTAKPWRKFVRKLKDYNDNMVKGWKEDIDTLLVYVSHIIRIFVTSQH